MLYKNARNKVKPEMRKSKYTYESDLDFKISKLKLPCWTLTNDNKQKAGLLNKFFTSVFEIEGVEPIPDFPDRELNEAITTVDDSENVILKAISKLKPSKSQGPDN